MLRVADPAGSALPRVSQKIRCLQDRIMDSLPTDGAWECLSPAQREAIMSLHHNRLFGGGSNNNHSANNTNNINNNTNDDDAGGRVSRKLNYHQNMARYTRSRSYEDKLESETDDSGARGLGGSAGTSSGTHSHNSHEDDSSDPGVNRPNAVVAVAGRFAKSNVKSSSVDRANYTRKNVNGANLSPNNNNIVIGHYPHSPRVPVTNGFGNVNRMISKQMNKNIGISSSNITLDCRNVQGEKRRRSCIFNDEEDPFNKDNFDYDPARSGGYSQSPRGDGPTSLRHDDPVPADRAALSRRKILNKYETETKHREYNGQFHQLARSNARDYKTSSRMTPSSEEYDSGVAFKLDRHQDSSDPAHFAREQPKSFSSYTNSSIDTAHNFNSIQNGHSRGNFPCDRNANFLPKNTVMNNNIIGPPNSFTNNLTGGFHISSRNEDSISLTREDSSSLAMTELNNVSRSMDYFHSTKYLTIPGIVKSSESGVSRAAIMRHTAAINELKSVNNQNRLTNTEPLKSNLKSGCGDKMNSSLDYRSTMNQDVHNRYSNNWNEIILNNQVTSKVNAKYDARNDDNSFKSISNPLTKSTGNITVDMLANNINNNNGIPRNEVNFQHNDLDRWDRVHDKILPKKYVRSKSLDRKYLEDSSEDESDFEARRRFEREQRYARNPEWDALRTKQSEIRVKKTYNTVVNSNTIGRDLSCGGTRLNKVNWESTLTTDIVSPQQQHLQKPKASSVWDLSRSSNNKISDEFEDPSNVMGFRSRGEVRSKWQNIDRKLNQDEFEMDFKSRRRDDPDKYYVSQNTPGIRTETPNVNNTPNKLLDNTPVGRRTEETLHHSRPTEVVTKPSTTKTITMRSPTMGAPAAAIDQKIQWSRREFMESREFSQKQWRRRSCDFELDAPDEPLSLDQIAWDRKRWYRRSCDLDLDFDQHYRNKTNNNVKEQENLNSVQQFQSLPPFREGLQLPEEIILDNKRCIGRREGAMRPINSESNPSSSDNSPPLTLEELRMLDSGHSMFLVDKSRIPIRDSSRVDGRSKSRLDENVRNQQHLNSATFNIRKSRGGERPKTSIGQYASKEKRERSRTPHVLKGKLRLFKSILSF